MTPNDGLFSPTGGWSIMGNVAAPVCLTIDGTIATVTLNRPDRLNAVDLEMAREFKVLACEIAKQNDLRVIVICGNGPAFCAGGDIGAFAARLDDIAPMVTELLDAYHHFVAMLADTPKLVLTSVHGTAAGAGLSLAAMGDLCIASDDARFTAAYAKLGLSPDGGGTIGLVRAVGTRRAAQILLAEDYVSAEQAEQWGLVNKVVPRAALEHETFMLARRLACNEPAAAAATKALLRRSHMTETRDQLKAEMGHLLGCMNSTAFRQAVVRFMAR